MTEVQADTIIDLLKEISDKLTPKSSTTLNTLHHDIEDVKKSVDKVVDSIKDLNIS